jgi:sialate O-acetylesterase
MEIKHFLSCIETRCRFKGIFSILFILMLLTETLQSREPNFNDRGFEFRNRWFFIYESKLPLRIPEYYTPEQKRSLQRSREYSVQHEIKIRPERERQMSWWLSFVASNPPWDTQTFEKEKELAKKYDSLAQEMLPRGKAMDLTPEEERKALSKYFELKTGENEMLQKHEEYYYEIIRKRKLLSLSEQKALSELIRLQGNVGCVISLNVRDNTCHVTALSFDAFELASNPNGYEKIVDEWVDDFEREIHGFGQKEREIFKQFTHLNTLRFNDSYRTNNVFETAGDIKNLKMFRPPRASIDEDIGNLKNLDNIEFLTLWDCLFLEGKFIEKFSANSKLRILQTGKSAIQLKYLEKLKELPNFLYFEDTWGGRVYRSQIPEYIRICREKGYSTLFALERIKMEPDSLEIGDFPSYAELKRVGDMWRNRIRGQKLSDERRKSPFVLAEIFGDGMVLQRNVPLPVWGRGKPNSEVSVSFSGQNKTTRADASGSWSLRLDALPASSQGNVLSVCNDGATVKIKDVLVGEVWLYAGGEDIPFNYSALLKRETGTSKIIQESNNPQIRIRRLHPKSETQPRSLFLEGGLWKICSVEALALPDNISEHTMSFLAFRFAKELQQKLNVPVGLLQATHEESALMSNWTAPEGFLQISNLKHLAIPPSKRPPPPPKPDLFYESPDGKRHILETTPVESTESYIFNGTIYPFIPFVIRGVIWPEINGRISEDSENLQALIKGWRSVWKQGDFPFYFISLVPNAKDANGKVPEKGERVRKLPSIPNTGVVFVNDLVDFRQTDDLVLAQIKVIDTLATRLARFTLSHTYGMQLCEGTETIHKSLESKSNAVSSQALKQHKED